MKRSAVVGNNGGISAAVDQEVVFGHEGGGEGFRKEDGMEEEEESDGEGSGGVHGWGVGEDRVRSWKEWRRRGKCYLWELLLLCGEG